MSLFILPTMRNTYKIMDSSSSHDHPDIRASARLRSRVRNSYFTCYQLLRSVYFVAPQTLEIRSDGFYRYCLGLGLCYLQCRCALFGLMAKPVYLPGLDWPFCSTGRVYDVNLWYWRSSLLWWNLGGYHRQIGLYSRYGLYSCKSSFKRWGMTGWHLLQIWISPIVENLPQDTSDGEGYHGYWAQDIYAVNTNFGAASDLVALSAALHDRGMVSSVLRLCLQD